MASYLRNAKRIVTTRLKGSGEIFTKPGTFLRKTASRVVKNPLGEVTSGGPGLMSPIPGTSAVITPAASVTVGKAGNFLDEKLIPGATRKKMMNLSHKMRTDSPTWDRIEQSLNKGRDGVWGKIKGAGKTYVEGIKSSGEQLRKRPVMFSDKLHMEKHFSLKDPLVVALSAAGVGLSAANLHTNRKRYKEDNKYRDKQLEHLDELTKSIKKLDKSIKDMPNISQQPQETPKKSSGFRLFKFLQKNNSYTSDYTLRGAALGSSLALGASPFLPDNLGEKKTSKVLVKKGDKSKNIKSEYAEKTSFVPRNRFERKYNEMSSVVRKSLLTLGGMAIGATLGAIAGGVMDIANAISGRHSLNNRLFKDVIRNLVNTGYVEGRDFTRDPKMSNLMKTKVCLVVSKSSDELRLLINMVNDKDLAKIAKKITTNLPAMSTVNERVTDRYNDINITALTSNGGNATWVTSIAERFIKEGYPVYLVEVG